MKIIMGNWKMNPASKEEAKRILREVKKIAIKNPEVKMVVFPPAIYASLAVPNALNKKYFESGLQNVFSEEAGSFTGEISAQMIKDSGITYVLIGHSERRKMGENDEFIAKKVNLALKVGLKVVLCIGEKERDSQGEYMSFLKNQIRMSLDKVQKRSVKNLTIAYEPVWAIGGTQAMDYTEIHETSLFIKKTLADLFGQEEALKVPILYGGSVNFRNAREIVEDGKVDGLLIGRESVNPAGFSEIVKEISLIKD